MEPLSIITCVILSILTLGALAFTGLCFKNAKKGDYPLIIMGIAGLIVSVGLGYLAYISAAWPLYVAGEIILKVLADVFLILFSAFIFRVAGEALNVPGGVLMFFIMILCALTFIGLAIGIWFI